MKNILIIAILIVLISPILVSSQPTNLTDREVLIQMYEKITFIEETVRRINSDNMKIDGRVTSIEGRVIKNEINVAGFYEKLGELVARWNTLLGLFVAFITGIFVRMWRKSYNGKPIKETKHITH